jgi:hypothetical protein
MAKEETAMGVPPDKLVVLEFTELTGTKLIGRRHDVTRRSTAWEYTFDADDAPGGNTSIADALFISTGRSRIEVMPNVLDPYALDVDVNGNVKWPYRKRSSDEVEFITVFPPGCGVEKFGRQFTSARRKSGNRVAVLFFADKSDNNNIGLTWRTYPTAESADAIVERLRRENTAPRDAASASPGSATVATSPVIVPPANAPQKPPNHFAVLAAVILLVLIVAALVLFAVAMTSASAVAATLSALVAIMIIALVIFGVIIGKISPAAAVDRLVKLLPRRENRVR